MKEISVVIDCSGSMASLSKRDIVQSAVRNLLLHENFSFDFYSWSLSVSALPYDEVSALSLEFGGKTDINALLHFLESKIAERKKSVVLVTDGFFDGNTENLRTFQRETPDLKLRLLGVGADFSETSAQFFFPKDFVVEKKENLIFSASDLEALLFSFYEDL